MHNAGALSKIKVLDLSRLLPGPYCSMILADHGAEVIAIEDRRYEEEGHFLRNLYRNKKHMTLDIKTPGGKEIFFRLVKEADVFIEGFRPGATKRLGIDYDALRDVNPGIIYCSITGYGQSGCLKDVTGHDVNYLSYTGLLDQIGIPGSPPVIPGIPIADIAGGSMNAVIGILLALFARERTGKGQYIDISMTDGALSLMHLALFYRDKFGEIFQRGDGLLSHRYACYNTYETADGRYLSLGAVEYRFWKTICEHLDVPEYVSLQHDESRAREITDRFRIIFKEKTLAEWEKELAEVDTCWAPIRNLDEALKEPIFRERQMVMTIEGEKGPIKQTIGIPVKLSGTPGSLRTPSVHLGENTSDILVTMGYSEEEIEDLKREGAI